MIQAPTPPQATFIASLKTLKEKFDPQQPDMAAFKIELSYIDYFLDKLIADHDKGIDPAPITRARFEGLIQSGHFDPAPTEYKYIDTLLFYSQLYIKELTARGYIPNDQEVLIYNHSIISPESTSEEIRHRLMLETAFSSISDQDEQAALWDKKINLYRSELKKYYYKYNFTCLSRAFVHLLKNKKKTLCIQRLFLILFGFILVSLPAYSFFRLTKNFLVTSIDLKLLSLVPILTTELLIIYFFKILLRQYLNTHSQILQIELRRALSAFIEGYAQYKKDNLNVLPDRFEQLIFSPLTPLAGKMPTTLDDIGQITKLIQVCKGK